MPGCCCGGRVIVSTVSGPPVDRSCFEVYDTRRRVVIKRDMSFTDAKTMRRILIESRVARQVEVRGCTDVLVGPPPGELPKIPN